MRGANVLDCVYRNISSMYRTEPDSHLSYSEQISADPSIQNTHQTWQALSKAEQKLEAIFVLQDCFEHTNWDMFQQPYQPGGLHAIGDWQHQK